MTRPRAASMYAKWTFHLAGGEKSVFQIAPSLYDPSTQVIPYLQRCCEAMRGADGIPREARPAQLLSPGGSEPNGPDDAKASRRFDGHSHADLCDVFMAYWGEIYREMPGDLLPFLRLPPAYVWEVWYSAGRPVELALRTNDKAGQVVTDFTIDRSGVPEVVAALDAPHVLNTIPKL